MGDDAPVSFLRPGISEDVDARRHEMEQRRENLNLKRQREAKQVEEERKKRKQEDERTLSTQEAEALIR